MKTKILKINGWPYYLLLCSIALLFTFLGNTFLYTDSLYYSSLGEQYTIEQIKRLMAISKSWKWVGYTLVPLLLITRISYSAFCLYIGDLFQETHWGFKQLFKSALFADTVFCLSVICNFYYYLISNNYHVTDDLSVNCLSLLKYTGKENIPNWLIFAFNSINVFEILYILTLAFLIRTIAKANYLKAFVFVCLTYGVGNYLYIASITFLYLNFS